MVLSLGDDAGSAASETFIVSVSTVSDILIAKSYREMLANTENLKDRNVSLRAIVFDTVKVKNTCLISVSQIHHIHNISPIKEQ